MLREAIRKGMVVKIVYEDGGGKRSERRTRPIAIWSFTDGWMFAAWCELRRDFRTFRFDRMTDATLTDDTFEADEATGLRAFMAMETCKQ